VIFALLPVKAPQHAKQRLSGFMTPAQREALARLMFKEALATLCAVKGLHGIAVATSDDAVAHHARSAGVLVFEESEQRGHSHSADSAARRAAELGATSVIMVPIDTPLASVAEIESLIAAAESGVVIVPSADGTGTNAMVHTPPGAIECSFGPGSFERHCGQARQKNLPLKVMRPPGLLFDIDTIEDVAELLARAPDSLTAQLLRKQWTFAS